MPPLTKRKKRGKYKSALSTLSDELSSGVDGTGFVNGGCSSRRRTTRANNQDDQDVNATVALGGPVDSPEDPGDRFGELAAENDQEKYNEKTDDNDNNDNDNDSDDDNEEEEEAISSINK
mmetsp:Transcript_33891/g.38108  ORF Transcript_33891/g.38108 Transcript_33891/m.38108 type:complete len:120 (+) Transcript_33891:61-420(+)